MRVIFEDIESLCTEPILVDWNNSIIDSSARTLHGLLVAMQKVKAGNSPTEVTQ